MFLVVQSLLTIPAAAPFLLDWVRVSLVTALGVVLMARFGQWQNGQTFLASLAGWSRIMWAVPLVAIFDGVMRWLWPELLSGAFWVIPQKVFMWLLAGWNGWGFASIGLLAFLMGCAWLAYQQATALGAVTVKRFASVLIVPLAWLLFLVPSLFAWTKLSSFGATFASDTSVVAQAFDRVFDRSAWSVGTERFLGSDVLHGMLTTKLVTMILAWLGLFIALAPRTNGGSLAAKRERGELLLPFIGAIAGGCIFGSIRVVGQTMLAQVIFWVTACALMALLARRLAGDGANELGSEINDREAVLLGSGVFLLGWPALVFSGLALGLKDLQTRMGAGLTGALLNGGILAILYLFGTALVQRSFSLGGWNPALLLGLFGAFGVLELLFPVMEGSGSMEGYLSTKPAKTRLALIWAGAIGLLWWGVGVWSFVGVALVLFFLLPAVLWLFSPSKRQLLYGKMAFAFFLGLLLHPGLFLP